MSERTVVVLGPPDVADLVQSAGQFQVLNAPSTSAFAALVKGDGTLRSIAKSDLVYLIADTLELDAPNLSLERLVDRMSTTGHHVIVLAYTPKAADLVATYPAAGLLRGPFEVNALLAAVAGKTGWQVTPLDAGLVTATPNTAPVSPAPSAAPHGGFPTFLNAPVELPDDPAVVEAFPSFAASAPVSPQPTAVSPEVETGFGPIAPSAEAFTTPSVDPTPAAFPAPQDLPAPAPAVPAFGPAETVPTVPGFGPVEATPAVPGFGPVPPALAPVPAPAFGPGEHVPAAPAAPAVPPFGAPAPAPTGFGPVETAPAVPAFGTLPAAPAQAPGFGPTTPLTPAPAFGAPAPASNGTGSAQTLPAASGFGPLVPLGAMTSGLDYTGATPTRRGQMIAVAAPKGGVGKTSLTINLAAYAGLKLMAQGKRVAVIDANYQQGDIGKILSCYSPTLTDIARDPAYQTPSQIQRYMAKFPDINLDVVLAPNTAEESNPAWITPKLFNTVANSLREIYDLIFVDCPVAEPHHDLFQEFILPQADYLVMPVTPSMVTIHNARTWLSYLGNDPHSGVAYDPNKVGILFNQAQENVDVDVDTVRQNLPKWKFLAEIKNSKEWIRASNNNELVAVSNYADINAAFAAVMFDITHDEVFHADYSNLPHSKGLSGGKAGGLLSRLLGGLRK